MSGSLAELTLYLWRGPNTSGPWLVLYGLGLMSDFTSSVWKGI